MNEKLDDITISSSSKKQTTYTDDMSKCNDSLTEKEEIHFKEIIPEKSYQENEETDIEIVNKLATIDDDPNMVAFTFRSVLVGVILSGISSSVSQLMLFKPVGIPLTTTFMLMVGYVSCKAMEKYLPTGGWLNPGPFNTKEHTCIYVMVSSANTAAYGTMVLAAQHLYYHNVPSVLGSIAMLLATQLVGYGIAGQLRQTLVYPAKMIWPASLPTISLLRTLNANNEESRWRTRFFFITFAAIFIYEFIPQYMFPLLGGISVVCLANRKSIWAQRLFGGLAVNEGLGILQLSFDWNYLASLSPLVFPLWVQMNIYAGVLLLYVLAPLLYYFDVWNAQKFPFMSNSLFFLNQTTGESKVYPQHQVLNLDNSLNYTKLEQVGHPHFTTLGAIGYLFMNFAVTASVTHVLLYHGNIIWDTISSTRKKLGASTDIHMRLMSVYKEVPNWWYYCLFGGGIAMNIGVAYANESRLPWWGVITAISISLALSLPLNMIEAVTGQGFGLNVFAEMVGGFLFPGQPVANMYFKTLGYNTLAQAGRLAHDLKIGHYMKVPPRLVFFHQMLGTVVGSLFNYLINTIIVTSQKEILLDPATNSNTWNGASIQAMNAAAISWGAIGPMAMFGPDTQYSIILWAFLIGFILPLPFYFLHRRFPDVGFNLVNVPMILAGLLIMPGSASSYVLVSFILTISSQWYIKKYRRDWFVKYNYLVSTALDSGTSLMVFFVAFALMGGGDGNAYPFPVWFGNRSDAKYADYCCMDCK
ncbi:OPT family small oligopeptide transporter [Halteromyces radiatus]|uniref:OPT family small oligopeptide transporter n=1 Tax=Halteromyces radiatus TaxID=101107 RepID=UPI0022209ABF|nr:OPT family small oligopeptide transporter [Halteromyces radiatus]KAI8098759.1 OPT family small oligopeptide transporter [Halteromyces radiatus]